ncbi:MAG: PaaI family thioesterase [Desulfobacterales bacterium]|nr:PaaI family thioesterase [Desulfobacterales bacterium]
MIERPSTGPHRVELEKWIACAPFERLLGMEIKEADEGRAVLTMPFERQFAQGKGLLHGGALVSLADTAVVMAIKSLLPENTHFATVSLETNFLKPVRQGIVTARAWVVRREDRTLWGQATVYDESEAEVLAFTSVFKVAVSR